MFMVVRDQWSVLRAQEVAGRRVCWFGSPAVFGHPSPYLSFFYLYSSNHVYE